MFGYPLVYNLNALQAIARNGMGSLPPTPFNRFGFAQQLATPADPFVSVNNDTVYALAQLDLSGGPLRLHVPDTAGAYYVLQFVDAWTNNFAYVGRRATGTSEAEYLITPPGWSGDTGGLDVISAPTNIVSIVGRLACDGLDDLPRVLQLQQHFTLSPVDGNTTPAGIPSADADLSKPLHSWEQLRLWSQANPPTGSEDQAYLATLDSLGLLDPDSPYPGASEELVQLLTAGLITGKQRVEEAAKSGDPDAVNGWQMSLHLFDYNRDAFSIGTIDSDEWKIADPLTAYLDRAVAARNALWGNHAYEAVYPQIYVDSDGEQLTGSHRYTITFTQLPPVDAFWSMTMYAMPEYFLVDNPIGRYSIGDRTPGIRYGDDGSLTLYLQHQQPDAEQAANWLPTPDGDFRPMIRLYQPRPEILKGKFALPPIRRVD
ncbi:DUF1254 domain-containing protein [Microlunatus elymi]|uniref:DUF1254 domain-containing protein n=1 Tax=Microlunatus elymi TaxID=2596828 RepID=UPI001D188E0B|nr:DUF1254 domain-containing protein [Microlunatus elymi]